MTSPERQAKNQFAKVFVRSDWALFKKMAESQLREAARLRTVDMPFIERPLRLLARNSRKRLLIGIGVELLLKAVYLKNGFAINKPRAKGAYAFPFAARTVPAAELEAEDTYMLNDLIQQLHRVIHLTQGELILRGLKIAKVFRNKEGHVVTAAHRFAAGEYKDIATSIVLLYQDAFNQDLTLQFSMAEREPYRWRLVSA